MPEMVYALMRIASGDARRIRAGTVRIQGNGPDGLLT